MDAQTTLTLRCTACGALTQACCSCGAPYAYISPGKIAARAVKDNPDKSDRAIAEDLGIGAETVRRARQSGASNEATEKRTGRDGKKYKARKKSAPKPHYKEADIIARADLGMSFADIAAETGIGKRQIRHVVEREQTARKAKADPDIDRTILSMSAQAKLDAAIRQHKRQLDREYDQRRISEIQEHLKRIAPMLQEKENEAYRREQTYHEFMKKQKKIMTVAEFTLVCSLLHPDSRISASEERLRRAFQMFEPKKFPLTGER